MEGQQQLEPLDSDFNQLMDIPSPVKSKPDQQNRSSIKKSKLTIKKVVFPERPQQITSGNILVPENQLKYKAILEQQGQGEYEDTTFGDKIHICPTNPPRVLSAPQSKRRKSISQEQKQLAIKAAAQRKRENLNSAKKFKEFNQYHWANFSKIEEITAEYEIFKNILPNNPQQGKISNCYLVSAMSALGEFPEVVERLFNTQIRNTQNIYSINLCIDGLFQEIIIDGKIPVIKALHEKLIFCYSKDKNLWPTLLEKAYAKAYGSFWNIGNAGAPMRALKDLTGAPAEVLKFPRPKTEKQMARMKRNNPSLTNASIKRKENQEKIELFNKIKTFDLKEFIMVSPTNADIDQVETTKGIIPWHAYTVISALEIKGQSLVKLRNPHGIGEWMGEWCDDDTENWDPKTKQEHDFQALDDGIFYMPLDSYLLNFEEIVVCHYHPNYTLSAKPMSPADMKGKKAWDVEITVAGSYYFSLSQPDKLYPEINELKFMSMFMVKKTSPTKKAASSKKKQGIKHPYKYVGGKAIKERDCFFFKQRLQPGKYIIITNFPNNTNAKTKYGCLSAYGVGPVNFFHHKFTIKTNIKERKKNAENYGIMDIIISGVTDRIDHNKSNEDRIEQPKKGNQNSNWIPYKAKKQVYKSVEDCKNFKFKIDASADGWGGISFKNESKKAASVRAKLNFAKEKDVGEIFPAPVRRESMRTVDLIIFKTTQGVIIYEMKGDGCSLRLHTDVIFFG